MRKQLTLLLTAILLLTALLSCRPKATPPTNQASQSSTTMDSQNTATSTSIGQIEVVPLPGQDASTSNTIQVSPISEQQTEQLSEEVSPVTPEEVVNNETTSSDVSSQTIATIAEDATLNGSKYHEVVAGDNLYAIATLYKTTVDVLVELNGINDATSIQIGQRIFLPNN